MDMGEYFPCLGLYGRMKASTVLRGWGCFIAVSAVTARYGGVLTNRGGMVRGVSEIGVLRRHGEGFRRYRGRRVVCDERGDCAGGCWGMRGCDMHCVRHYVGGGER